MLHFFFFSTDYFLEDTPHFRKMECKSSLNLAKQLKRTNIHLNSNVEILDEQTLKSPDGNIQTYDFIVQAYPSPSTDFYSVTTDYFWTEEITQALHLNYLQNEVHQSYWFCFCFSPYYCPRGKSLYSVNSLRGNGRTNQFRADKPLSTKRV